MRTCFKCSAQHVLFLQKYKPGWQTQPQAVLGARPFFSDRLLRARHEVHRPWTAREVPLLTPDIIFFSPSRTCMQRPARRVNDIFPCALISWGLIQLLNQDAHELPK